MSEQSQGPCPEAVPIRQHLTSLIDGVKEYFQAVLDEQRRGMIVAEQEREKAATALGKTLQQQISDMSASLQHRIEVGDNNLREHIEQQVGQLRIEREGATELVAQQVHSLRSEMRIINDASEAAIAKADAANEKRFEATNEWRQQSLDRERTQQEQTAALSGTFMPREVAEAQISDLRRTIQELADKVNKVV
jgi:hypothetical protein